MFASRADSKKNFKLEMWGGGGADPVLSFQGVWVAELRALVPSPLGFPSLPSDCEERRVILFLELVFRVHHWNASPEKPPSERSQILANTCSFLRRVGDLA